MTREGVTRRLDRSGAAMGAATGAAQHVAPTEGGCYRNSWGGCYSHPRPCVAVAIRVVRPNPSDPSRASGEGKDGSDPPLLPLMRLVDGGGATARATARATAPSLDKGGSLPSVRIPAGRLTRPPEARADAPERGAMLDRLIRHVPRHRRCVLCGGAGPWPGPFPADDPLAVLVHFHTPNFSQAAVALVLHRAGPGRLSGRDAGRQHVPDLVRPRRRPARAPQPPSRLPRLAAVADVRRSRPSSSARCITPVNLVESPTPDWLVIPERGLYTGVAIFGAVGSGKTSACMHPFARQLLSWHAKQSRAARGRARARSEGRFLPRHPPGCSPTWAARDDYLELSMNGGMTWNPLSAWWLDSYSLAYTVASLLNQPLRQGEGTLLAAGVHQSGPVESSSSTACCRADG